MLEAEESLGWEVAHVPKGPATHNRWLQRTLSNTGQQLAQLRDRIFGLAQVERHDLVLDLNANTGLLTWEAVRRAAVGGVYTLAANPQTAEALRQQANNLEMLERPVILSGAITALPQLLIEERGHAESVGLTFDVIIGRNIFTRLDDKAEAARVIEQLLKAGGRLVLAEVIPKHTQRLHQLVDLSKLAEGLPERIVAAEEAIYQNETDPMVNWAETDLQQWFTAAGLSVEMKVEQKSAQYRLNPEELERWFAPTSAGERSSFAQHLLQPLAGLALTPAEVTALKQLFEKQLLGQMISWHSIIAYVVGHKS
jgi:putative ATPase